MDAKPLNSPPAPQSGGYVAPESFWRSLHYYHLYRFIVASLFALAAIFPTWSVPFGNENILLARWVSLLYLMFAAAAPPVLMRWRPPFNQLLTVEVFIDIAVLTLLMSTSGGNQSGFGYLLLVVLAAAGMLGQGRLTLFYASLATLAVLLEQGVRFLTRVSDPGDFTRTGIVCIGFFATAAIARLLARRVVINEALAQRRGLELANQLQVNQRVIRDMSDGVLVVDAQGNVTQHNPRAAALLECKPFESMRLQDFSSQLAQHYDMWRKSMAEVLEVIRASRSGKMLRVRFLPAGDTANALIYIEDMEQVQAQAQQIKLVAMGRLTANIAHEIRNPLAAISHATELLAEEQEPVTLQRLIRIIGDNTQRLNQLVTDVMELGRRDRAQPELIPLSDAIEMLVDDMALVETRVSMVVTIKCRPSMNLWFDRNHLQRVMTNLIENALRYCGNVAGSICVEVKGSADAVQLMVSDDGPGVARNVQEQLFEPFFTTRSTGTGLGLYIARELCEANGAKLELVNVDKGACFRITGKGS
jgi:two-component system, NtrC family, sensor histidine kinase PilS